VLAPPTTPPQQKPSPEPAPPKPKESKPLDVAEQFLCDARRDNAPVEITFTDGSALAGHPAWVGTYSVRVRLDDGTEAVAFKAAMKWIKRIPGQSTPPESDPETPPSA
jgi:sRNA-binding regulator protein Hfq